MLYERSPRPTCHAHAQGEELENPGTVLAVQDRTFRMSSELWIGIGVAPLDAFYKGVTGRIGYVFHFSDSFAWQVGRGLLSYNIKTGPPEPAGDAVRREPHGLPAAQLDRGLGRDVDADYGKTSWLTSSVGHFEVFGTLGGSVVNERIAADVASGSGQTVFRPAVHLGVGARVFTSKSVSFRLDFSNEFVIYKGLEANILLVQLALALNFGGTE